MYPAISNVDMLAYYEHFFNTDLFHLLVCMILAQHL